MTNDFSHETETERKEKKNHFETHEKKIEKFQTLKEKMNPDFKTSKRNEDPKITQKKYRRKLKWVNLNLPARWFEKISLSLFFLCSFL